MTQNVEVDVRQADAVRAFCAELLEDDVVDAATADALAAYHHRLPVSTARDDELLLAVTRLMAAVSLPDRSSPADRRDAMRASFAAEAQCTCREAVGMIAAHANGNLPPREAAALEHHLQGCDGCRAVVASMSRAEQRFRAALGGPRTLPTRGAMAVLAAAIALGVGTAIALGGGSPSQAATPGVVAGVPNGVPVVADVMPPPGSTGARAHRSAAVHRAHHVAPAKPARTTATATVPTTATTPAVTPALVTTAHAPTAQRASPTPKRHPSGAGRATTTTTSALPVDTAPTQGIGTITTPAGSTTTPTGTTTTPPPGG